MKVFNKTLKQPVPKLDYPVATDEYGRPLDPTTVVRARLPKDGEDPTPDSIFNVQGSFGQFHGVTVPEILEQSYQQGFRGRVTYHLLSEHPVARKEEHKAAIRTERYPRTDCRICTAYIAGKLTLRGCALVELRHAGLAGCSACSALYQASHILPESSV
jgi:hypothetical protein